MLWFSESKKLIFPILNVPPTDLNIDFTGLISKKRIAGIYTNGRVRHLRKLSKLSLAPLSSERLQTISFVSGLIKSPNLVREKDAHAYVEENYALSGARRSVLHVRARAHRARAIEDKSER